MTLTMRRLPLRLFRAFFGRLGAIVLTPLFWYHWWCNSSSNIFIWRLLLLRWIFFYHEYNMGVSISATSAGVEMTVNTAVYHRRSWLVMSRQIVYGSFRGDSMRLEIGECGENGQQQLTKTKLLVIKSILLMMTTEGNSTDSTTS